MAIRRYFAMTAAEIRGNPLLPPGTAWMACHFSPYGTGLSNLPRDLPPGALLTLNDRTPIHGHDPDRIAGQLAEAVTSLDCWGVLLDFQRPGVEEIAALAGHLAQALPCPVAVSDLYARELNCPVFLSPVPADMALGDYLAPWQGREVWLDLALDGEVITLTEKGAAAAPLLPGTVLEGGQQEETLHCHYQIALSDSDAKFSLWRTAEDLERLLAEAEELGVTTAVGLYQELHGHLIPR